MREHPTETTLAYELYGPGRPLHPVVLDSPHSGTFVPEDGPRHVPNELLVQAGDLAVDWLWQGALAEDATLLCATVVRAYLDLNRAVTDLSPEQLVELPYQLQPTEKAAAGIGLIWSRLGPHVLLPQPLTASDVQKRLSAYYQPYYRRLGEALQASKEIFPLVVHLNCHSMPAVERGPDICLGNRSGETASNNVTQKIAEMLVGQGFSVAINAPYKGAEIVRRFGKPALGVQSVQMEISRRLYLDASGNVDPNRSSALRQRLVLFYSRLVQVVRTDQLRHVA